uniref:Uncharacterized protein n=1 Tax=Arundo donax TaxID=35708 RepID=A0A0A9GKL9_ARUDO
MFDSSLNQGNYC